MNGCKGYDEKLSGSEKAVLIIAGMWCLLFVGLAVLGAMHVAEYVGWL